MNLDEYIKQASNGATVIVITPEGSPIVAHTWASAVHGRRGWEYVLADYHGKILGQAWIAGGPKDRDEDIAATIAKFTKLAEIKKRISARTVVA